MAGYVYRGKGGPERRNPNRAMSDAEKDHIAVAVLRIVKSLDASLAASAERAFRAMERSCCNVCGALYAGGHCDLCQARSKPRPDVAA